MMLANKLLDLHNICWPGWHHAWHAGHASMDKNQIDEFIYICLHCHVYDYIINQLYILHTFMYMISLSLY